MAKKYSHNDTIEVRLETKATGISSAWVIRVIGHALQAEKVNGLRVGVLITDDKSIRRLNKEFLKHDYATDVISFGAQESEYLGDIVVSTDTAKRIAKELNISLKEETARYLIHGLLHLVGYDDKSPRGFRRMHARQEKILKSVRLTRQ